MVERPNPSSTPSRPGGPNEPRRRTRDGRRSRGPAHQGAAVKASADRPPPPRPPTRRLAGRGHKGRTTGRPGRAADGEHRAGRLARLGRKPVVWLAGLVVAAPPPRPPGAPPSPPGPPFRPP